MEIERRRRARATPKMKDVRASPAMKESWASEFMVTGGVEAISRALRYWRADLARHLSNAAMAPHALSALRASTHAAAFSYQQYEAIVAEIAKSAVATAMLWVHLEAKGSVRRKRGGGPARYQVALEEEGA